jgi:hypothetical protein
LAAICAAIFSCATHRISSVCAAKNARTVLSALIESASSIYVHIRRATVSSFEPFLGPRTNAVFAKDDRMKVSASGHAGPATFVANGVTFGFGIKDMPMNESVMEAPFFIKVT